MKLSFVIPAHNEEETIGQCLLSIMRELERGSYNIEVIVVNNASTDATGEIARRYPGVVVVDEPKKGLERVMGSGLSK
jgi:glycosyltransferase involved in cell wall biosynthesis